VHQHPKTRAVTSLGVDHVIDPWSSSWSISFIIPSTHFYYKKRVIPKNIVQDHKEFFLLFICEVWMCIPLVVRWRRAHPLPCIPYGGTNAIRKKTMCFSLLSVHRVPRPQSVAATSPVGIIRNGPLLIFGSMRAKLNIITIDFYNELQFLL
jgi:hypothetical protein